MLTVRGLTKEYLPGQPVLRGVSLDIKPSGLTAIIGASGAGKSTLIRCINRLVEPTSGSIEFEGRDLVKLDRRSLREVRRTIGMVFQEYNLVERLSVMENLLCGRLGYVSAWRAWLRRYPAADIERAFELLRIVGLAGFEARRADGLSGGQRQRVGIARAVMQNPRLLLADEPTSSLDPRTSVDIMLLLSSLGESLGAPVIVNMHNVALARRFASHIIGMASGSVVYNGTPEDLTDVQLQRIYGGEDWLS